MTAKFKTAEEYFAHHYSKCGRFHTVHTMLRPHKWKAYGSPDYSWYSDRNIRNPYHREVLPNEVVIDIDTDDTTIRDESTKQIIEELTREKIAHSVWRTGGKGIHIHSYWKSLGKLTSEDRKLMKTLLIHHYCYGLIDKAKIDMQLTGRHMVRAEYGRHESSGRYKTYMSSVDELAENTIPSVVVDKFTQRKKEQKEWIPSQKTVNGGTPDCIRFFISDDFRACKDGRKRAMFALCSWYKAQGLTQAEIVEKIKHWNHYNCLDHIADRTIESCARNTKGIMSCRARHALLRSLNKQEVIEQCDRKRGIKTDENH